MLAFGSPSIAHGLGYLLILAPCTRLVCVLHLLGSFGSFGLAPYGAHRGLCPTKYWHPVMRFWGGYPYLVTSQHVDAGWVVFIHTIILDQLFLCASLKPEVAGTRTEWSKLTLEVIHAFMLILR